MIVGQVKCDWPLEKPRDGRLGRNVAIDGRMAQEKNWIGGRCNGFDPQFDLAGIAGKLLAQCHGDRVLQMGAADFPDVGKTFGFFDEHLVQPRQRRQQAGADGHPGCHVDGRRDRIVARLAQVHMVIGVDR